MNQWVGRWVGGSLDGYMGRGGGWMDRQVDGWMTWCLDGWVGRWKCSKMSG